MLPMAIVCPAYSIQLVLKNSKEAEQSLQSTNCEIHTQSWIISFRYWIYQIPIKNGGWSILCMNYPKLFSVLGQKHGVMGQSFWDVPYRPRKWRRVCCFSILYSQPWPITNVWTQADGNRFKLSRSSMDCRALVSFFDWAAQAPNHSVPPSVQHPASADNPPLQDTEFIAPLEKGNEQWATKNIWDDWNLFVP